MTLQITTLDNGLRVVSDHMEHLATTSLGVWVATGARHESEAENGISHLLEHMAFKGTRQRSARDIAEEIEALGGELNAATGHETTAYYARVLAGDEAAALAILADILQDPKFAVEDLKREQEVIVQEIAATQDCPEDIVFDLLHDAAYPDQALGRPILGSPERVQQFSSNDLKEFLNRRYRPNRMIVSAAGGVHHDALVRHVEALFTGPNQASDGLVEQIQTGAQQGAQNGTEYLAKYVGGTVASSKPFEQCHVAMGFLGPSYRDQTFFAAQVFSGIFGGGMSSRLFQEVREKRGLCYSIYSSVWGLEDTGMIYLHAAMAPQAAGELTDIIAAELSAMCDKPPLETEVLRSKAQLKVGLLMALESSAARAEQMARHLSAYDRVISKDDLIARVDAVTPDDVLHCARATAASVPTISVVGAGKRSQQIAEHAAHQFATPQKRDLAHGLSESR